MQPKTTAYQYPFGDPELSHEERIADLLTLMTLDEKVACLGTQPDVPRLGIVGTDHAEGLHGLAMGGPGRWGGANPIPTTTFPQAYGLGETWDAELVRQVGAVEGYEARYIAQSSKYGRSHLVVRAPNADLGRDPRWGRTEECYGEDAYFNGTMTVAFIRGLQGDHPTYWQAAALLKHFLANSNERDRGSSSSDFDERLLREYYSVPFRMGIVEGGARAFMAAYNKYNGIPCVVHPILREITVDEWGCDGIICTDGGGMRQLVTGHNYVPDFEHSAARIIQAGVGQFLDDYHAAVHGALQRGLLTEAEIDAVLKTTFRVMLRLGLLDPPERVPYASIGTDENDPWLGEKHQALARLVTQKSIVLLKNSANLLPLDRQTIRSIAVIGPRADDVWIDWYSGTPPYTVSPLEGIRNKVGDDVSVRFALSNNNDAAIKLAQSCDVAIVCVGNHPVCNTGWDVPGLPSEGKESIDREALRLEYEDLIQQVYSANPNTVVVLISSFPYAINWTQQHVPAIVHMAHNSQETGSALADVLFGDYNPAGRLVQTWPGSLDQLPPMMDYDLRHGRTYMYSTHEPLYPFGYGLSYTTFDYANLRTSAATVSADATITISVDLTNTGDRAGEEVVQLYVRHLESGVERPLSELKGFARVAVQPGETTTVVLPLDAAQLAYWDVDQHRFVVERGKVEIMIGRSSADIVCRTTIEVVG
ncbi:MAG TPA: glycoside hydrolase family 3 C-terminal domain-containing protein [Herpetosiphonaceae bacterium]